ncbi:MAG: hypothetical protein HJJLKODD_02589 [Phycisphaerae bacterium]|nr:hypothetical protein [Phycisphaerae bacterium]
MKILHSCLYLNRWVVLFCFAVGGITGCGPNQFELYRRQGLQMVQDQRYEAAAGAFREAMLRVPQHTDNLCDIAWCHLRIAEQYMSREDPQAASREIDVAINYYNRAIKYYPGYQRALDGKNHALEMKGQYVEALATIQWASRNVGPDAATHIRLAQEYAERGDADRALLTYRQAVAMEPENPVPNRMIGQYYLTLGRRDEAVYYLQRSYQLDPTQTLVAEELDRLGVEVAPPSADQAVINEPHS